MKIVVAPDSFKGSLSAEEVGKTIKKGILYEFPTAKVTIIPMADGGEGTLEALIFSTKGVIINLEATGIFFEKKPVSYGILGDEKTVIIEIAKIVGLANVPDKKKNPLITTTYGIGETILNALDNGYRKFIIGLGGSATNDGGIGMLKALGGEFLDKSNSPVVPIGSALREIEYVDLSNIDSRIYQSEIIIASDVNNPLCGKEGASYVFGPQKGASLEQVKELDEGLNNFGKLIEQHLNKNLINIPGAGAAGGLGFALLAIGAKIQSGAKIVAEMSGLEKEIAGAQWVITGEGRSDYQTIYGKAPIFVAEIARKHNVKAILLSGSLGEGFERLYDYFVSLHSIVREPTTLDDAMQNVKKYLFESARNITRLLQTISSE